MNSYEQKILLEALARISSLEERVDKLEMEKETPKNENDQETLGTSKKYRALSDYLSECEEHQISLTFAKIEDLLGFKLPTSAYIHRAFWANTTSHSIALSWLSVGYEIVEVDFKNKSVTFEEKKKKVVSYTLGEFQKWFSLLVQKVDELDFGDKFTLPMILEEEWLNISVETRRSLGKSFYQHVVAKKIINVLPINVGTNPQEYKKIEMN